MTTIGLVLNLVGVFMLFRYGMPFRIPSIDGQDVVTVNANEAVKLGDRHYNFLGGVGLAFIVLATIFQIIPLYF